MAIRLSPNRLLTDARVRPPLSVAEISRAHARVRREPAARKLYAETFQFSVARCAELLKPLGNVAEVLVLPLYPSSGTRGTDSRESELQGIDSVVLGTGTRRDHQPFSFRGFECLQSTEVWVPDVRFAAWLYFGDGEVDDWVLEEILQIGVLGLDLASAHFSKAFITYYLSVSAMRSFWAWQLLRRLLLLHEFVTKTHPDVLRTRQQEIVAEACAAFAAAGGPVVDPVQWSVPLTAETFAVVCHSLALNPEEDAAARQLWERYVESGEDDVPPPPALRVRCCVGRRRRWRVVEQTVGDLGDAFRALVQLTDLEEPVDRAALAARIAELTPVCCNLDGQDARWTVFAKAARAFAAAAGVYK